MAEARRQAKFRKKRGKKKVARMSLNSAGGKRKKTDILFRIIWKHTVPKEENFLIAAKGKENHSRSLLQRRGGVGEGKDVLF